jgi:hypothetical protein
MCGSFCGGSNNKSSEMEVDGEKMMSLDELRRYLDETRCVCCVFGIAIHRHRYFTTVEHQTNQTFVFAFYLHHDFMICRNRRQLCSAHCSIAELYLTDLCDDPDAEANCEKELESALKLDELSSKFYLEITASNTAMMKNDNDENKDALAPPPPDALQTMANLRMSQSRPQDALDCIFKAYDRMGRIGQRRRRQRKQ